MNNPEEKITRKEWVLIVWVWLIALLAVARVIFKVWIWISG